MRQGFRYVAHGCLVPIHLTAEHLSDRRRHFRQDQRADHLRTMTRSTRAKTCQLAQVKGLLRKEEPSLLVPPTLRNTVSLLNAHCLVLQDWIYFTALPALNTHRAKTFPTNGWENHFLMAKIGFWGHFPINWGYIWSKKVVKDFRLGNHTWHIWE